MLRGKMTLRNFDQWAEQMKRLGVEFKKQEAEILRAGAKPIHATTKSLAPRKSGALAKSIKIKTRRRKGKVTVAIQTARGDFKGDTFYAAFQELGTAERFHKSGKSVGQVGAKNFFAEGFNREQANAEAIIERGVLEVINGV